MPNRTPPTIFVVDADDLSRHRLCETLRTFGWNAAGFTPAQMCRNATLSTADCLLLDVPESASIAVQVLAALHLRGILMPVIAITTHIDAELVVRARARSVRAVVRRPFNAEELRATILHVISGRATLADA